MKKAHTRLLWHLKELNKMFSDEPSYYSMKRFQQAILFLNAIVILDVWTWKNINDLESMEALEIFGANLLYAGFIVNHIQKEKKLNKEDPKEPEQL